MLPEVIELNGIDCRLIIRRNARKNMIVRIPYRDVVQLSVPRRLSARAINAWLQQHAGQLAQWQAQVSLHSDTEAALPAQVWYLGQACAVVEEKRTVADFDGRVFRLPQDHNTVQKKSAIADILYARAQAVLLPRLQALAAETSLQPEAIRLSRAKSFWGVCRARRIGLNWRLIGAIPEVIDYVCIHELCHLREAHHGKAFWALVHAHYADTKTAKKWLKTHRSQLFLLG